MDLELTVTDPAPTAPDEQTSVPAPRQRKETRPRFDTPVGIGGEVSFRKDLPEPPVAEPDAIAPEPAVPPPAPPVAPEPQPDEESETALVKVERKPLAGIAPIEIDYSRYVAPQYQRVDMIGKLRSVQKEAVDEFFATKLRRPVIILPTGCVEGSAIVQVNRAGKGKGFKITLEQLYRRFNNVRPNRGPCWDQSIPTYVKALAGDSLKQHRIHGVLDKGEKDVVELTLASGKKLRLTPDHEVCVGSSVADGQIFRRADELSAGDDVLTNGRPSCFVPKIDKVVSVKPAGRAHVYDIVCEDPWRNFVANGIVVHNCGKTVAGLTIAGRINGRVLWIAHRDELIEQPAKEIRTLFPGLEFGIEKADSTKGTGKRVVIASIQTLQRMDRLKRIMDGAPFSIVIYDECLPGDELVITNEGLVRMDDPRLAELSVLAWSIPENKPVFRRVLRHITRTVREVVKVTTEKGRVIRCTDNERFLSNGKWKYLTDLKPGDPILTVDTGSAHAVADKRSSSRSRTSGMGSGTGGLLGRSLPLVTTCADKTCDASSSRARAAAVRSSTRPSTDSSATTSADGRPGLTLASSAPSTGRCSATQASAEPTDHASTSHMASSRENGPSTKLVRSAPFSGGSRSSRTPATATSPSPEGRSAGPNSPRFETSSSQTDGSTTSASPAAGSTESTREAARGGTWTTASSSATAPVSSTHRDSRGTSAESSPTGSRISDSGPPSSAQPDARRTEASRSTSSSEWASTPPPPGARNSSSSASRQCSTSSEELIESIEPDGQELVFDLEVEEDHNFITASGFVVHNCHHATSASATKVLTRLGCLREDGKGPLLLGLTATIKRADKVDLGSVFEDVIYSCSIQKAIQLGYLVKPKEKKVYLPFDKKKLKKNLDGDYAINDLDRELTRLKAAQATAVAIKVNCESRKTIVFCTSINQAQRTAAACRKLGLKAAWASGLGRKKIDAQATCSCEERDEDHYPPCPLAPTGMSKTQRKETLAAFSAGELQILSCADLLTEGYDEKSIGAVVVARPTKSQSRYIQMAGRGLRTCEHKVDCLVIDITSASDLNLVGAEILLKKPTDKKPKKRRSRSDVPDSSTEWQKLQSYLRSAQVDTLEHGELTFARASEDLFVTVAKDRDLVLVRRLVQDTDQWVVEHGGVAYTPMPLTFTEALSVCDTLMPSFGGGVKPGSEEWDAATERPTPPPASQPGGFTIEARPADSLVETTVIAEPASRLPIATSFVDGSGVSDLADLVTRDLLNTNAAAFAKGLRSAFRDGKCHLLGVNKLAPADPERWGWAKTSMSVYKPKGHASPMIGWVYGDTAFVDPDAVGIAQAQLATLKDGHQIRLELLRKHLGVTSKSFMDMKKDWLKIQAKDIDHTAEEKKP